MKKLLSGLLVLGLTTQFYAQVVDDQLLPEVEIYAMNYKYLNSIDNKSATFDIRNLEQKVANYDLQSADFYIEDYDLYKVTFYIPDGIIVAAYDSEGEVLYTIERFKDTKLPKPVVKSINKKFPGWTISKDVYKLSYTKKGGAKKTYKITLDNGVKKLRVKTDENGSFI
jgi:hypothetical protein